MDDEKTIINSAKALLKSFDDGLTNNIDPGKPESRNIYEAQKAGKDVKKLPLSLGEALDRLKEDKVIQSAMPDEMYKVFHWYKNDEWEKFSASSGLKKTCCVLPFKTSL